MATPPLLASCCVPTFAILSAGVTYRLKAADTWAVGVTLHCMVMGKFPFIGETLQDTYDMLPNCSRAMDVDLEEYNKMKEADPEFYMEASSLQYGMAPKISEDRIDQMLIRQ